MDSRGVQVARTGAADEPIGAAGADEAGGVSTASVLRFGGDLNGDGCGG